MIGRLLEACPRTHLARSESRVEFGLQDEHGFFLQLVAVSHRKQIECFRASHSAVPKIELCHGRGSTSNTDRVQKTLRKISEALAFGGGSNQTGPLSKNESGKASQNGAALVGAGIFLSRLTGLAREKVFAHYFGNTWISDSIKAALKIPNFLQNLLGEGVLSASFIPIYASQLTNGDEKEAGRVAGAVASLLFFATSILVLLGVWSTPYLIDLIAPGFQGDQRTLTIRLVQIFFPGTGLLVLSAWCLGILNSHKKFFLSYVAPVILNIFTVVSLIFLAKRSSLENLALQLAWVTVVGSGLQFLVQLPSTLSLAKHLRFAFALHNPLVRNVLRNFFPVVLARGVVQLSAYIDNVMASLLPTGAVSSLAYAQMIYLLPVSLFGMSVSAAELPTMSGAQGSADEIAQFLNGRLNKGLEQIAFFIVPTVAAFLALGDVIIAALYQGGAFTRENTMSVWAVLAGSTVGLLASTMGRLYSSTFYSLKDTRTPLKFATLRVTLTLSLGWIFAFALPRWLGISPSWGTAGLTSSAGLAGWMEFALLRRALNRKIGDTGLSLRFQGKLWIAAMIASLLAYMTQAALPQSLHHILRAVAVFSVFAFSNLAATRFLGVPQAKALSDKIIKRFSGK